MTPVKRQSVVERDGVIHIDGLPFRQGDRIEATLSLVNGTNDKDRKAARERLMELCRQSTFRSAGPYPTRDELHERA